MTRRSGSWLRLLAALLVAIGPGSRAAADGLLYVVEGERLVFTNTPSRSDARPVPGIEPEIRERSDGLPRTIYDRFIEQVASENGLSPSLIKAVALVESGFDPHAVSPKGAQGLMQLMPGTARHYGVRDAFDPLENLRAGTVHLGRLLDEFDGDVTLALAAYNAGSEAVRRHGGIPAYPETQEYVRRVRERLGRKAPPERSSRPEPREVQLLRRADGSVFLVN